MWSCITVFLASACKHKMIYNLLNHWIHVTAVYPEHFFFYFYLWNRILLLGFFPIHLFTKCYPSDRLSAALAFRSETIQHVQNKTNTKSITPRVCQHTCVGRRFQSIITFNLLLLSHLFLVYFIITFISSYLLSHLFSYYNEYRTGRRQ